MPITTAILLREATDQQVLSFLAFFGFVCFGLLLLLLASNKED